MRELLGKAVAVNILNGNIVVETSSLVKNVVVTHQLVSFLLAKEFELLVGVCHRCILV